ncbi:MAG: outer membrane lipoprotein carrier protein LolA [Holosporales bacterium]|jgi:hypothetical protein|nr:outer membrane lipoprotein carrier protein LolA [Holosporales bacterium]
MRDYLRLIGLTFLSICFSVFPICSKDTSVQTQVEAYVNGIKFIAAKFEQVTNSGEIYSGNFWLSKKKKMMVKIDYLNGLNQDILIVDGNVTILNKDTAKLYRCSISQTPIYAILTGSLDLSRENFDVIENSSCRLRVKIKKSSRFGSIDVTLVFLKYEKTGNLKNLEAWIIDDGKTETLFSFDPDYLFINDENKIPSGIFALSQAPN